MRQTLTERADRGSIRPVPVTDLSNLDVRCNALSGRSRRTGQTRDLAHRGRLLATPELPVDGEIHVELLGANPVAGGSLPIHVTVAQLE